MFGLKQIKLPSPPNRNYETLDAIAVIGSLGIVAGIVVGLFMYTLDPAVAPIVASLATAILGIPVSYGAFRWGNSVGSKAATEAAGKAAEKSADALASIAGATPPELAPAKQPVSVVIEQPANQPVPTTTEPLVIEDEDPVPPDEATLARPLGVA